jgi:hypothetical protein
MSYISLMSFMRNEFETPRDLSEDSGVFFYIEVCVGLVGDL